MEVSRTPSEAPNVAVANEYCLGSLTDKIADDKKTTCDAKKFSGTWLY